MLNFPGWELEVNFSTGRQENHPGWYEKNNEVDWKNTYPWLANKNRNGRVTFKCQKTLWNIA